MLLLLLKTSAEHSVDYIQFVNIFDISVVILGLSGVDCSILFVACVHCSSIIVMFLLELLVCCFNFCSIFVAVFIFLLDVYFGLDDISVQATVQLM